MGTGTVATERSQDHRREDVLPSKAYASVDRRMLIVSCQAYGEEHRAGCFALSFMRPAQGISHGGFEG